VFKFAIALNFGAVYSYCDLMCNEMPRTAKEYMELRGDVVGILLFHYETLESAGVLSVRHSLDLDHLRQFVALISQIDLESDQELFLFAGFGYPDSSPLQAIPPQLESLYFLVAVIDAARNRRIVVVDWSDDLYDLTSRRTFFVSLPRELPTVRDRMGKLFGTERIRILVIRRFEIERVYDPDAGRVEHIRFERIPDDQVGVDDLLRAAQVELDAGRTHEPVNFPFFLRIAPSFRLAALTELIGRVCKEQGQVQRSPLGLDEREVRTGVMRGAN
jgi:hypothetical protein